MASGNTPSEQNGVCAICSGVSKNKSLAVDHNHVTGIVRGLLCDRCNRGLGNFQDSPKYFRRALEYLGTYGDR